MDRFEVLSSAVVSDVIPVTKYRSKETGFTLCIADVAGPIVNGFFCLATEAHDDDGLPHTLEHIVFLGSEEYPYKGMLDMLANRCLAQGSNAWTDTDHTCYTMTTAGSEGFLNLLPIYLDHLLYPTISEAHFITEVHHVNGEGEDAGVVYCEMQARENTGGSLTQVDFLRAMYPGKCGYKSETGGIMKNLRETCSHSKVKSYHSEFYRPENLCLIITGNIKAEDVFKAIKPFEDKIKSNLNSSLPSYVRPWMSEIQELSASVSKTIEFPTEDESTGMVKFGWRGPDINAYYEIQALRMLFNYLTDTPVAPLQRDLVEIDDPLCGDIDYSFFENKTTCVMLCVENVPKENLNDIKDEVLSVLEKLLSGEEAFDMDRMLTQIHRVLLEEMSSVEDEPHDTLAMLCIADFLYSQSNTSMQETIDKIGHLRRLKKENAEFWLNLMRKYVDKDKMVLIIGDPSEEKMKVMGEKEKQRVKRQREELGEDGLAKKKRILEEALEENSKEPPVELLTKLDVPSTDSITFHDIKSYSNRSQTPCNFEEAKLFPVNGFPVAFYANHLKSLFTEICVMIDSVNIPNELQMYLPLYTEILFESPILRDGKLIPYEDVVNELNADTLQMNAGIGISGGRFSPGLFSSLVTLTFKVENEKYEKAVQWVKDVLYNLQFSVDRLKSVANKMINDVANYKRSGRGVVSSIIQDILYTKDCNIYGSNMVRQHTFLKTLVKNLSSNPDEIITDMEALRKELLSPQNFRFYVTANLNSLPSNAEKIWMDKLFKDTENVIDKVQKVPRNSKFLSGKRKLYAIGVGSVESSYLLQRCSGIDDYNHPDYPAILLFIEYLCAVEGPLWRQIRGCGYSYNYQMNVSPDTNLLSFTLARATHVFQAYKIAKEIVDDFVSGKTPFDIAQLEAARSGVIYGTISKEETMDGAVTQNVIGEFREVKKDFNRTLLKKLSQVTTDDLQRVGKTYFTKLFDPNVVAASLCCHPTKLSEVLNAFKGFGVTFEDVKTLEDLFLEK